MRAVFRRSVRMTPELTVLALAAVWQAVQIVLAGAAMNRDVGFAWKSEGSTAGSFDEPSFYALVEQAAARAKAGS